jgi:hypothetical protein
MHIKILSILFTLALGWPALALEAGTYRGKNTKAWIWNECQVSVYFAPDGTLHLLSFTDSNHAYNLWGESTHVFPGEGNQIRAISYLKFDYRDAAGTWIYQSQDDGEDATIEISLSLGADNRPQAFQLKHKSLKSRPDWDNEIQCEDLKPAP